MDKKLINEASNGLELLDVFLYTSSVDRYENIYDDDYPDDMTQQSKISIKAEILESVSDEDNENKDFIQAKVSLGIRFMFGNKKEAKPLCEIEACFIAKYLQEEKVSEDAISEFVKYNVIHNVWPFWREHAFRMSREAKLPLPIIPLFNNQVLDDE